MNRNRILPAALAALALAVATVFALPVAATDAMAKQEGLECTACHDKPGSKLLTDKGKYYELMHSLEGYDAIQASFGACTSCHVSKPGSHELTEKGKQLDEAMKDMQALRDHVMKEHPEPAPADPK